MEWVKRIRQNGFYNNIVQELKIEDRFSFKMLRMDRFRLGIYLRKNLTSNISKENQWRPPTNSSFYHSLSTKVSLNRLTIRTFDVRKKIRTFESGNVKKLHQTDQTSNFPILIKKNVWWKYVLEHIIKHHQTRFFLLFQKIKKFMHIRKPIKHFIKHQKMLMFDEMFERFASCE